MFCWGRMLLSAVSNSTWIAEDRACLTHGLRGVVHCNLVVCLVSSFFETMG
jgi:hypothetical protein